MPQLYKEILTVKSSEINRATSHNHAPLRPVCQRRWDLQGPWLRYKIGHPVIVFLFWKDVFAINSFVHERLTAQVLKQDLDRSRQDTTDQLRPTPIRKSLA
jgi:hypothetical protein